MERQTKMVLLQFLLLLCGCCWTWWLTRLSIHCYNTYFYRCCNV